MVLLGTTYEMLAEVDIQSLVRKLAMKLRAIVHGLQALLVAAPAAALEFQHCLPTSLPPARLWSYLAAALRGEDTQGLWPRRLPFRLYEALFFDSLRRRLKALETADESTGR
jgi:hypothetical protein